MNEEQRKANRSGNRCAACVIVYAIYCAIVAIAANNGSTIFQSKAIGFCLAPVLSIYFLYLLLNYLADLLQYYKEGWNLDQRRPRVTMYPEESPMGPNDPPISSFATMWFAYPLTITGIGLVDAFALANVFGYLGK